MRVTRDDLQGWQVTMYVREDDGSMAELTREEANTVAQKKGWEMEAGDGCDFIATLDPETFIALARNGMFYGGVQVGDGTRQATDRVVQIRIDAGDGIEYEDVSDKPGLDVDEIRRRATVIAGHKKNRDFVMAYNTADPANLSAVRERHANWMAEELTLMCKDLFGDG